MKTLRQEIVDFINKTDASFPMHVIGAAPDVAIAVGKFFNTMQGVLEGHRLNGILYKGFNTYRLENEIKVKISEALKNGVKEHKATYIKGWTTELDGGGLKDLAEAYPGFERFYQLHVGSLDGKGVHGSGHFADYFERWRKA